MPRLMYSATLQVLDQAEDILRQADEREIPMLSGEILKRLNARGINVNGKAPRGSLASKLGCDRRFRSHGHARGWSLSGKPAPPGLGVADLERILYGNATRASSRRQHVLREALRALGYGVGHGRRYRFTREEIERLAPAVRATARLLNSRIT